MSLDEILWHPTLITIAVPAVMGEDIAVMALVGIIQLWVSFFVGFVYYMVILYIGIMLYYFGNYIQYGYLVYRESITFIYISNPI